VKKIKNQSAKIKMTNQNSKIKGTQASCPCCIIRGLESRLSFFIFTLSFCILIFDF